MSEDSETTTVSNAAGQAGAESSRLGPAPGENEAKHLRRVASELGGANADILRELVRALRGPDLAGRAAAAITLGEIGDRHAIGELRRMLESETPQDWEIAARGLRHMKNRAGWLCLETVALGSLGAISRPDRREHEPPSFRILVMGRTKTMDRLFRAVDGHSRSIPAAAALNFARVAVRSVAPELCEVMGLRLGLFDAGVRTAGEIAGRTRRSTREVRELESRAWETVQRPRPFEEIISAYRMNT